LSRAADRRPRSRAALAISLAQWLDTLRQRGVLTDEEFDQQKAKLLAQ